MSEELEPSNIEAFINAFQSIGAGDLADDTAEHMRECVKADTMDIIEMAESLQGITQVDSIQRNTKNKFSISAEVKTSKINMIIPRIITFEFPVFRNDMELTTRFETELFLTADSGSFSAELICYNNDQLVDETRRQLTSSIYDNIDGVNAYAV